MDGKQARRQLASNLLSQKCIDQDPVADCFKCLSCGFSSMFQADVWNHFCQACLDKELANHPVAAVEPFEETIDGILSLYLPEHLNTNMNPGLECRNDTDTWMVRLNPKKDRREMIAFFQDELISLFDNTEAEIHSAFVVTPNNPNIPMLGFLTFNTAVRDLVPCTQILCENKITVEPWCMRVYLLRVWQREAEIRDWPRQLRPFVKDPGWQKIKQQIEMRMTTCKQLSCENKVHSTLIKSFGEAATTMKARVRHELEQVLAHASFTEQARAQGAQAQGAQAQGAQAQGAQAQLAQARGAQAQLAQARGAQAQGAQAQLAQAQLERIAELERVVCAQAQALEAQARGAQARNALSGADNNCTCSVLGLLATDAVPKDSIYVPQNLLDKMNTSKHPCGTHATQQGRDLFLSLSEIKDVDNCHLIHSGLNMRRSKICALSEIFAKACMRDSGCHSRLAFATVSIDVEQPDWSKSFLEVINHARDRKHTWHEKCDFFQQFSDPLKEDDISLPLCAHVMRACLLEMVSELSVNCMPVLMNIEPNSVTNERNHLPDGNVMCHMVALFGCDKFAGRTQRYYIEKSHEIAKEFGCCMKRHPNLSEEAGSKPCFQFSDMNFEDVARLVNYLQDFHEKKRNRYPGWERNQNNVPLITCCAATELPFATNLPICFMLGKGDPPVTKRMCKLDKNKIFQLKVRQEIRSKGYDGLVASQNTQPSFAETFPDTSSSREHFNCGPKKRKQNPPVDPPADPGNNYDDVLVEVSQLTQEQEEDAA